jgi:hypothetical protein
VCGGRVVGYRVFPLEPIPLLGTRSRQVGNGNARKAPFYGHFERLVSVFWLEDGPQGILFWSSVSIGGAVPCLFLCPVR